MIRIIRICRKCGAKIFSDAPEELCTGCVLETALRMFPDPFVGAGDDCGSAGDVETNGANTAPQRKKAAHAANMLGELGDYELLKEIGRGGQGVVFRARQKSLNRTVALKVIGLGQWATEAHLKRFRLEAEAAASLDHPCIVPIYEVGERDGSCFFSMKFVEGGQLDEVIRRAPMSIRQAAELMIKVARTVHYAHEHGILHRDIKPGNILLDTKGEPHLTDFGLARLVETESTVTRTLEVLGTPSYMAPEQAAGETGKLTSATDVYGLGAVLYQLLTGHPPFAGGTTYETIRLLLDTEPRQPRLLNSKINRDLSTICLKCLQKDPQRRYSSALALAEDLERWLKHEPIWARRTGIFTRGRKWLRRNPTTAALVALSLALTATVGVFVWKSDLAARSPTTGVAVLPFENLSNDKEDASFADGVQDDLLTKLAKVADLKVISRTSVMQYRDKQYMRQIGKELQVSHVLEGSVRKTGAWLHINVQLIDTRSDAHVWAEQYDRDLKEIFALQSEIAQKVAERLHAKISAAEKLAIERPPTADLTAFNFYNRAKTFLLDIVVGSTGTRKASLLKAADLLNQAVAHDPTFFQAYCQLAWTHDNIYFDGWDRTPARLALAEAAIQAAFHLRPDAGEVHLARAWNLYWGYRDYDAALAELDVARETLPNDAWLVALKGFIERRQGRWEESVQNLERALNLDPRNFLLLRQIAILYDDLRRYAEQQAALDRALSLRPNDLEVKVDRANVEIDWRANTGPVHQLIDEVHAKDPGALQSVADYWLLCALAERDSAAAGNALAELGDNSVGTEKVKYGPHLMEGLVDRMAKDDAKARAAFTAARADQEKLVSANPDDAGALGVLGLIDAGLGRKEEALREGWRAVELLPVEKDARSGPAMIVCLARIAAWVGDNDLACEQLARASRLPSSVSYGDLKLMPWWDPLRDEPCFEKIVASLAPNEIPGAAGIAVLPFANLSSDEENAYFVEGIQDEILTRLSKIADLKVVSHTSTQHYESAPQDLPEIARELGVAHVLEGSVQKSGDAVHINVQLVDGRTDAHLWAESYDRELKNIFGVEREVAETVARQLKARLLPQEANELARVPTKNLQAYDLYLRGRYVIEQAWNLQVDSEKPAIDFFKEAIALDPDFALAYAALARAQWGLYVTGDYSPERLAEVQANVEKSLALQPDLVEGHLVRAKICSYVKHDNASALAECEPLLQRFPNNAELVVAVAQGKGKAGDWQAELAGIERAVELDPRNTKYLRYLADKYASLRRFAEAEQTYQREIVLARDDWTAQLNRALNLINQGKLSEARDATMTMPDTKLMTLTLALKYSILQLIETYRRDYDAALFAASKIPALNRVPTQAVPAGDIKKHTDTGFDLLYRGDVASARQEFIQARDSLEAQRPGHLEDVDFHNVDALTEAGLGDRIAALKAARKTVALAPIEDDVHNGSVYLLTLAQVHAHFGEADEAIRLVEKLLNLPVTGDIITTAVLRVDPIWDPIRADPRFQKLVAGPEPK
jgi:TolB-like protein/Flp pilus assembly protein TadD